MSIAFAACMLVVAFIHVLPLAGVLGGQRLQSLYAVDLSDPNTEILLRHRAVLFGLLGAFLTWAAFEPALRFVGLVAGYVSVLSFLVLARTPKNPVLRKVFIADVIALVALAGATLAALLSTSSLNN